MAVVEVVAAQVEHDELAHVQPVEGKSVEHGDTENTGKGDVRLPLHCNVSVLMEEGNEGREPVKELFASSSVRKFENEENDGSMPVKWLLARERMPSEVGRSEIAIVPVKRLCDTLSEFNC